MSDVGKRFDMKKLGEVAVILNELYGKLVGFRISLERPMDIVRKFCVPTPAGRANCENDLASIRLDLAEVIPHILELAGNDKRNYDNGDGANMQKEYEVIQDHEWSRINSELMSQKSQWKKIICKWQGRLRSQHSQAKSFNRSLWDQFEDVHNVSSGHHDSVSYSRCSGDRGSTENTKTRKFCDENEYYDRKFYLMLLKKFISNDSNNNQIKASESWGTDMQAFRKSKRKNADVDTRASKGRRLRYSSHPTLRNFMFPSDMSEAREIMDDRLINSLFQ